MYKRYNISELDTMSICLIKYIFISLKCLIECYYIKTREYILMKIYYYHPIYMKNIYINVNYFILNSLQ